MHRPNITLAFFFFL